jgi:hypothetical protein
MSRIDFLRPTGAVGGVRKGVNMPQPPMKEDMDALALSVGRVVIVSALLEDELTRSLGTILSLIEVQERAILRAMPHIAEGDPPTPDCQGLSLVGR